MGQKKDLSGMRFGRVLVIKDTGRRSESKKIIYSCVCDCGIFFETIGPSLSTGDTKSCGCLKREVLRTHGMSDTKLYRRWADMLSRCRCENSSNYEFYGGKGVTVVKEWGDFKNFKDWALSNGYDPKLSIDRIDPAGNYEPDNCRWADRKTQDANKRNALSVEISGETVSLKEIEEKTGINYSCLKYRYHIGIRDERILLSSNRRQRFGEI